MHMTSSLESMKAFSATTALLAKSDERLAAAIHALQTIAARTTEDNVDAARLAITTLQSIGAKVTLENIGHTEEF